MADNVTLPGTGVVVLSDDVGSGVQAQVVKTAFGSDGTATQVSTASPLPVVPLSPAVVLTGSISTSGDIIASQDVLGGGYLSVYFAITGTFTATIRLQGSNDNTNWNNVNFGVVSTNIYAGSASSSVAAGSTAALYQAAASFRYFKIATSSYTSGTINATMMLSPAHATMVPVIVGSSSIVSVGPSSVTSPADGISTNLWAAQAAYGYGFNGSTFDRERYSEIFKSAAVTASGDTTVWTPTSAKRWQLQRFQIFVSNDAAQTTGGVITVKLRDNSTTDIGINIPVYVPTSGGILAGSWTSGEIDLGKYGKRSSAINQVFGVSLSAALTAGTIGVVAMGTEE